MSGLTRRDVLKLAGAAGAALALPAGAASASTGGKGSAPPHAVAMLYDASVCTGCKACMSACNAVNGLEPDTEMGGGLHQMPIDLNARTKNIIKLYQSPGGSWSFVKRQCMHCLEPACAAGCPFKALVKDKELGVVTWDGSRCIGCRYCEISCPYQIPKFEWDKFNPRIVKCEFCYTQRLKEGKQPGCTGACPTGAVTYGTREAILGEARNRIASNPGKYFENRIYGESDAGGTQVFYLSRLPFEAIGLPALGKESNPHYATEVSSKVYGWLAGPTLLFAMLFGAINRNWKHHEAERIQHEAEEGHLPEQL
jgi:Fe-S-cluster-containing dehydrogenase component